MSKSFVVFTLALMLLPPGLACTSVRGPLYAGAAAQALSQQGASQAQKFTPVEGADLRSKLDDAARRAKSARQSSYWTAYSFDVRPGVAVDLGGGEFHGWMQSDGGTSVFIGTSNGMTVETRDLAVFVLRDSARADAVTRMEVFNLARPREYGGYPVYWAGRAGNEESLDYLRSFVESNQKPTLQERATLALALHDDRRVGDILKGFVRTSRNERVRSASVFWLGQVGGETAYLATLVRDEKEDTDLRQTAAHSIGAGRDAEALTTLQSLYSTITNRDVRVAIIHAAAENENRDAAYAFLVRVAHDDKDPEARGQAAHRLGERWGEAAIDELSKIYSTERDTEVREQVIHALAEIQGPRAETKLVEIARSDADPDLRQQAIHRLGERGTDSSFDELTKLFASERNPEVKGQILHAFSEMESPRAEERLLAVAHDRNENTEVRQQAIHWLGERQGDAAVDELLRIFKADSNNEVREQIIHALSEMKSQRAEDDLFDIARTADNEELRQTAIHRLGELASQRSFEMLSGTVNDSSEKTEVQLQAVRAISERPPEQSVPALIRIAKTHPNAEVRKEAIRRLGESGDPRAVEFFHEILSK